MGCGTGYLNGCRLIHPNHYRQTLQNRAESIASKAIQAIMSRSGHSCTEIMMVVSNDGVWGYCSREVPIFQGQKTLRALGLDHARPTMISIVRYRKGA